MSKCRRALGYIITFPSGTKIVLESISRQHYAAMGIYLILTIKVNERKSNSAHSASIVTNQSPITSAKLLFPRSSLVKSVAYQMYAPLLSFFKKTTSQGFIFRPMITIADRHSCLLPLSVWQISCGTLKTCIY